MVEESVVEDFLELVGEEAAEVEDFLEVVEEVVVCSTLSSSTHSVYIVEFLAGSFLLFEQRLANFGHSLICFHFHRDTFQYRPFNCCRLAYLRYC